MLYSFADAYAGRTSSFQVMSPSTPSCRDELDTIPIWDHTPGAIPDGAARRQRPDLSRAWLAARQMGGRLLAYRGSSPRIKADAAEKLSTICA